VQLRAGVRHQAQAGRETGLVVVGSLDAMRHGPACSVMWPA
jgi:hypothetical protein